MCVPSSKSEAFDHYKDVRAFSGFWAISGFSTAIFVTCILAGSTDGFQPDPAFYRIACPILYAIPGLIIIGSLIACAIASCKMRSLSNSREDYAPYTKL